MRISTMVMAAAVGCMAFIAAACSSPEEKIESAVAEASKQCPIEVEAEMVLTDIDVTGEGDVRFCLQAPTLMNDSAVVALTLANPDYQAYWLDLLLPPQPNAKFIDAVREGGHCFVISVVLPDSTVVEQRVSPQ